MATGGAWQSEYFEKPRGPGPQMDNPAPAAAPTMGAQATPPPMYYVHKPSRNRNCIIASAVLRLLTLLFALGALAILVFNKGKFGLQTRNGNVQVHTVRYTVLRAFKYLFFACCIVAGYSLAMLVLSLVSLCVNALADSKFVLWITFLFDQVLAYLLISAGAAGANGVMASANFENITGITSSAYTCKSLGISAFCNRTAASVSLALAAFLFLAVTAVLSSHRLFRR